MSVTAGGERLYSSNMADPDEDEVRRPAKAIATLNRARMPSSDRALLELRGSFKVGPGDPAEDVRRARALMGQEGT
jgi:hypothetical protein